MSSEIVSQNQLCGDFFSDGCNCTVYCTEFSGDGTVAGIIHAEQLSSAENKHLRAQISER